MRISPRYLFPLVLVVATVGCAHRIDTIGSFNPECLRGVQPGATVHVEKLPAKDPFAYDALLVRKMERILERKGYAITTREDAEFLVLYDYRVSSRRAQMKLELLTGAAEGMQTVRSGGPHTHVLELRVVDARLYRRQLYVESLVWEGGALLGDAPTESSRFHDMVLLAAFDQFGLTTADDSNVRMRVNNSAAHELRHDAAVAAAPH